MKRKEKRKEGRTIKKVKFCEGERNGGFNAWGVLKEEEQERSVRMKTLDTRRKINNHR